MLYIPSGTTDASLRCFKGVDMSIKSSATWKYNKLDNVYLIWPNKTIYSKTC